MENIHMYVDMLRTKSLAKKQLGKESTGVLSALLRAGRFKAYARLVVCAVDSSYTMPLTDTVVVATGPLWVLRLVLFMQLDLPRTDYKRTLTGELARVIHESPDCINQQMESDSGDVMYTYCNHADATVHDVRWMIRCVTSADDISSAVFALIDSKRWKECYVDAILEARRIIHVNNKIWSVYVNHALRVGNHAFVRALYIVSAKCPIDLWMSIEDIPCSSLAVLDAMHVGFPIDVYMTKWRMKAIAKNGALSAASILAAYLCAFPDPVTRVCWGVRECRKDNVTAASFLGDCMVMADGRLFQGITLIKQSISTAHHVCPPGVLSIVLAYAGWDKYTPHLLCRK